MSHSNISTALKAICLETRARDLKEACHQVTEKLEKKLIGFPEVVQILSDYILKFDNATLFRKYLSNILLALVTAKIPLKHLFTHEDSHNHNDCEKFSHLEYSIVLALLSDHPDILQYTLKYFEINPVPPFQVFIQHENSYNVAPKKRRLQDYRQKITDFHVVKCCHTLLTKLPNQLASKWDWSKFVSDFSFHDNPEIRWMVKECITILTNMTEIQAKCLTKKLHLTDTDVLKYTIEKGHQKITSLEDSIDLNTSSVVNIEGIFLPVYENDNVQHGTLVPVKSTVNNLRSLALAVASGKALCLLGPVGSGKTSLVEHLAAITGRKSKSFKKIQLGDQSDSRMLLGTHQCTDIPGEFVWRPGVLTEAVEYGHWLLLEDIDCAALDVASTLSSLLERNALSVPGYRDSLPVSPGFQLFVTQRTMVTNYGFQKKMSNASSLLQKHLTQINVEPLSRSELGEIIQTVYPKLTTICSRMIEVFMMFSVGSHDTSLHATETSENKESHNLSIMRGSRLISTRDLMKWCARAVIGFDVSSPGSALKVLQDALDLFTCSVPSPENRLELAKNVGTCLGIVETKSEFYCKHHKPNVSLNPSILEVGRAKLIRKEMFLESLDFDTRQVVFSFTRQSACLLERIACCVTAHEPVLLVGETGTGKTSSVQYLARQTGHKLVVINMNQQSDSADLLGGYKPVDLKYVIRPIRNEFEQIFRSYYNTDKNKRFLHHIDTCYESENWNSLLVLIKHSYKAALNRLSKENQGVLLSKWKALGSKLTRLEQQIKAASRLTFAFIEGSLVKAMQEGHWVLLDEINLASAEILECLAGLLDDKNETIDLLEKGDKVPIRRHPDFTLFACMNPATDVGKKDLPVGLRNRFTEFFIDELTDRNDLMLLIGDYLYHMNLSGVVFEAIYQFYANIKKEAQQTLVDGAGNAPHYSLRTLCRALTAAAKAKCGTVARSLYEAFCLSFLTQLDSSSHPKVEAMIAKAVIGKKNLKSVLNQIIPEPQIEGQKHLLFEGHWIPQGTLEISISEDYILTPTVRKNLRDIARIISLGKLPILLQGDTSVGKTSLITYIAKTSGNYCVRINNHEHTDLQEYIGSYASDSNGKLIFKEGVLVEAMRKGYWIILDELNLAPSDVLEALNRVLDDNRELFIPETQQVIKADPNFMLFATQNPPGLYGGRKMLSRAFRNRFVELHFDEIPKKELETILHRRCDIPRSYSEKMIAVMADLHVRRRGSAAVQGKHGFITLRDLFRWGQRYKLVSKEDFTSDKFYDWDQHIADEGYLVLAGKVRQPDERLIIEHVIEKHIKRKVDSNNLFSLHQNTSPVTQSILEEVLNNNLTEFSHVVWTYNMRRLAVLIAKGFKFSEPVLLVGETGCGKTTICQVLAALRKSKLLSVNCHMHTESADFLGGLRPVRQYKNDGRLFEWVDGPLIEAMHGGHIFLADEISLADDSVLERMNSLLEPERQLVLAEKGSDDSEDILVITATKDFHFIGTMNPGGDFGKKELSPALRNRFTEIWCDSVTSRKDLLKVLERIVSKGISLGNQEDGTSGIGNCILDFTDWLKNSEVTNKFPFSIRDLISWVHFINSTVSKRLLDTSDAYVHGACMAFLDCFGTALTGHIDVETLIMLRTTAIDFLLNQIKLFGNECTENLEKLLSGKQKNIIAESYISKFGIKPFYINVGPNLKPNKINDKKFTFTAPTTGANTLRLLRGLQLNKAVLLEGNPGVGKTSLVTALAEASGHKVVRINLSDQTDITDLFGTDLPSEDGSFTFKEGTFLKALQNGDWILLDELNLAPQPVLEGLNACLDHRGEVFIPELVKTFKLHPHTRIFACQNPLKQGGARRGLPISFLNRFTQVYIDTLTEDDLLFIVESQYPTISKDILHRIVKFNCKVSQEISVLQSWGHRGSPWEMNLRDIQRWCDAIVNDEKSVEVVSPGKFVDILYINRMRTIEDKQRMAEVYHDVFYPNYPQNDMVPQIFINENQLTLGDVTIDRNIERKFNNRSIFESGNVVLRHQLPVLKALAQHVKMNWLSIIVGSTATGKSSVVQILADLTGNKLEVVPVTSAMDVSDLLGGFEQIDYNRNLESVYEKIETLTIQTVRNLWLTQVNEKMQTFNLLSQLHEYKCIESSVDKDNISNYDVKKFHEKVNYLLQHCDQLIECNKEQKESYSILHDLKLNLTTLKTKITNMANLNLGGKFEWVDSVLVKSMMEGSWLLLDNVNLTSAAVLDRLNGLLEPNGTLSIPERGEMDEISPHDNFRIFFTVDPKYGEISRAMRNRGVELFIVNSDQHNTSLVDSMSHLDLNALLGSCGLPSEYHEICVEAHKLMTSFIQGLEKPTVAQLLQAAYLTCQQIIRGIAFKTAVVNSFSDVYIKPRCGGDFASTINTSLAEMKNSMLSSLQKLVLDYQLEGPPCTMHTLCVIGLCKDSSYEIVKQISYPLIQQWTDMDLKYANHCLFNLLLAYEKCSMENHETLNKFLQHELQAKHNSAITSLNDKLIEVAITVVREETKTFTEDFKLTTKKIRHNNTKYLTLYNALLNVYVDMYSPKNMFSALDYSNSVLSGNITDDFVEYPVLKNCQKYIQVVDDYINKLLKDVHVIIDDKIACKVVQNLNWRSRFLTICSSPIFFMTKNKRNPVLKEKIVPLMYIHSKWLQKYLIDKLFELLPPNHDLNMNFKREMKELLFEESENDKYFNKISKKLRKKCGQPKLYESEEEYQTCVTKANIYSKLYLDLNQPLQKQLHKLSLESASKTNSDLALDVPGNNALKSLQFITETSISNKQVIIGSEIRLLPIRDYIVLRTINLIQSNFMKIVSKIQSTQCEIKHATLTHTNIIFEMEFSNILYFLVEYASEIKGFPLELGNILKLLCKLQGASSKEICERISSFSVNFWNEFYKELVNSPARNPNLFLLVKTDCSNDEREEIIDHNLRLSTNHPLMPYYVYKLTIASNINDGLRHCLAYECVSLNDRADYSMQLGTMLNILWNNMAMLNSSAALKLRSDAVFEMQKYQQLIYNLYFVVVPNCDMNYEAYSNEIAQSLIQSLQKILTDEYAYLIQLIMEAHDAHLKLNDTMFSNNMSDTEKLKVKILTGKVSLFTSLIFLKLMAEISPVDEIEKHRLKISYINEDVKIFDTLLSAYYMQGVVTGTIIQTQKCERSSDVKPDFYKMGNSNRENLKKVHPFCHIILDLKEETALKVNKYSHGNTFRPSKPSYLGFVKDCKHFTKSILSTKSTEGLSRNNLNISDLLLRDLESKQVNSTSLRKAQNIIKETSSWLYSVEAFYKKVKSDYSEAFPDLAKPLLTSLSQMLYSVSYLNDLIKELTVKIKHGFGLREVATELMMYPNHIPNYNKREQYLNRFVNTDFIKFVNQKVTFDNSCDSSYLAELETFELLKMNLSELKIHCLSVEQIDKSSTNSIETTLSVLVKTWEKQQRDIEKKRIDEEALYVTKSKCEDVDEDVETNRELLEMFPSYSDTDFSEFKSPLLEQTKCTKKLNHTENKDCSVHIVKQDDISMVYKWHSSVVRNLCTAEWLHRSKKLSPTDYVTPLLQRYPIFSRVMCNAWEALDADFEGIISPSLLLLISKIKAEVDGNDLQTQKLDFYHSSWVSETKQCLPLLHQVKDNANLLLDQWPDFPTLKDIILIVNRILNFSLTSPVARFLTGLELLRDKIEEWNKCAHKGNNMIEVSLVVGQQIIDWRKLEMANWKESLNNLYERKQVEAHKFWFHLHNVIHIYLYDNANVENDRKLIPPEKLLGQFMETATLADYEVRLDLIYTYHCHLVHIERSTRRDELLSILWNIFKYYSQFSPQVSAYIKEKRAPIEKKLRDFVKICSWDRDLSYWSVKDTVDKAHKILHKHSKEFEKMLQESVSRCLVIDNSTEMGADHVGIWDRPKRTVTPTTLTGGAYLVDLLNYVVLPRNVKKYLDQSQQPASVVPESALLQKVPSLFNKAKILCKKAMTNTNYPVLVQSLDDFLTQVIETSSHLGSLEVDTSAPKSKQTSQAKNILQQKRKALADLFRYLTKMGLNYRTGLVLLSASNNDLYDFTIPPVNLDAAISYLKMKRCDSSLYLLWSDCENYFQKNIARHKFLASALLAPHADLGLQNMERCKGFAAILMKITNTQKKAISKYSRQLCDMRNVTTNLTAALDIENTGKNLNALNDRADILFECYANATIVLEQFCLILKSCPEKDISLQCEPSFDSVLSDSPIVNCYRNNEEWKRLYDKIKSIISVVKKQKTALRKLNDTLPHALGKIVELSTFSQSHIDVTNDAKSNLKFIKNEIDTLIQEYQFKFKSSVVEGYVPEHPMLTSIVSLSKYISETLNKINELSALNVEAMEIDDDDVVVEFTRESEDLIATMLLIIQSVYKKHLPKDQNESCDILNAIDDYIDEGNRNGNDPNEESKEILEDNHLKVLLQENISTDMKMLQLDALIEKTRKLVNKYVHSLQISAIDITTIKDLVMRVVPVLEQTVLFVQYFLTQQVALHRVSCKMLSVLLKIFSDLTTKGFCKPADLDMEAGEGENGPGQLSSGTGLGDGEGQNDVSDKIENQDQLDDAKHPGDEKEEENRDCKEEEKGINMTDDFDSHLQDVDKKDGEESEQEDDDNDIDKQMGETDNAAEKLDSQIWGSEEEDDLDEEQNDKNEKEDKGKGESTGEKEMAAKDKEQGLDDGNEGKDKKKKNDINEFKEPEVDDDHVDPYHGNQQPLPEPEDFDLPDDMNLDGNENDEDKDGETETENPFEIDVMKENIPEEKEDVGDDNDDNGKGKEDVVNLLSSDDEEDQDQDNSEQDQSENPEENAQKDIDDGGDSEGDRADEGVSQDDQEVPEEIDPREDAKNPDKINEEDKVEDKKQDPNPESNPSNDDPSQGDKAENAEMDRGTDDNVQLNPEQMKDENAAAFEQAQEQVGDEKQATGRSELDKSDKGHEGQKQRATRARDTVPKKEKEKRYENKPGRTEQDRTLGEVSDRKQKKTHTLNVEKDEDAIDEGGEGNSNDETEADAYQHVKQAKKDDIQAVDAATKEQAREQPMLQQDEEDAEELKPEDEIPMEVDDDIQVEKAENEMSSEKVGEKTKKEQEKVGNKKNEGGEEHNGEIGVEVEGEKVLTELVSRGTETTYHTRMGDSSNALEADMSVEQYMSIREWLLRGGGGVRGAGGAEGAAVWRGLWGEVRGQAQALSERLRLVLEPTGRSRLTGDYRTGRRINMRRVIPYIASHFRKDRIWLRRTKPAKREYNIALAIDDSSSMADNRSKELAFESLALVSQALNLLESGDLAVLSFGEKPDVLHPFSEQFSEHSGAKILEKLLFNQTKTKIAQLLDFCTVLFDEQTIKSDALNAKLLVIVSDGRGIFSEGEAKVLQSVRRARQQGIFLVYVIIDNPNNKDSIMDIRRPFFDPNTNILIGFVPYLDTFPFPYYLILREMSALPTVLGDALRQWFELAANNDS